MFLNSPFKSCYQSLFMIIDSASIMWNVTAIASTMTIKRANSLEMFHNHISGQIFTRELRNLDFEMTELKIDTVRFKKSSLTAFSRGKSKSSFRTVWIKRRLFRFLIKIVTLRY